MPCLRRIRVAREEDLRSQIGLSGRYFDLVDFTRVQVFEVAVSTPIRRFKEELAQEFATPVQFQRLWLWGKRQNRTFRPYRPLTAQEETLPELLGYQVGGLEFSRKLGEVYLFLEVLRPLHARNPISTEYVLVFLKLYDPGQSLLRYVGSLVVKASSRPLDILPELRTLAGLHENEEIELYEEIKFKPTLMCIAIDIRLSFSASQKIENGDIICYQKRPTLEERYPDVRLFFQHVLDQKEVQMKIQALQEEIVMLRQKACENEAKMECDQLKKERDNAIRQVDELRDQNRHVNLEFSLVDLEQATEHFSDVCKVGDTEYGRVYKGIIHKTIVAIKLSCSQSLFQREVSVLREGRHPNIVSIIGICSEASAIVYEWLPNGNLEDRIVCTNNSTPLSWSQRAQILGDICCTLLFLHSSKPSAMVHGDLRPCNILIDTSLRSKLCHFGLSDLFLEPGTCSTNLTARLPYMDPEFLTMGDITPLSDVYSLGVIILRLLTGLPPISIAKKVAMALKSDSLHLLIDKSAGDWPYSQAMQLALLGVSCVEMTRERRPDLLTKVWTVVEPMITKPPAASLPYFQSSSGPAHFFCPILMEIMNDPQMASDGFTYEAEAIRCWLDEGNNRDNHMNLKIVVKIDSYFALPDGGPKTFCHRKKLAPLNVDCHNFSLLELVNYIGESCIWGSKQYIVLWRSMVDNPVEIKSDEQLLEWCELNLQQGVVHIDAWIEDFDGPLQFSPTKRRLHPNVRTRVSEFETPPIHVQTDGLSQPTNECVPKRKVSVSKPKKLDDDESDTESLKALSDSSYDSDLAASSDSDCSDADYDSDAEILDDEEDDYVPPLAYDAENPCVDVGVIFPDVDQCKSALTHHGILNDYGFGTVKKSKSRFRAKCKRAEEGCKWEFFASTSKKKYISVYVDYLVY
ncbi:hypothetical protein EJB05_06070 [Eragrostis curvula]|uniref:RING-type E3 ubiquitin transferase n=1 Tax=Eragrostis curvula TaxID=38414 RepID=A0A5J9WDY4_9POAL|nr:hypothetical protein EJB05_06070 [Eragrostis curvula]